MLSPVMVFTFSDTSSHIRTPAFEALLVQRAAHQPLLGKELHLSKVIFFDIKGNLLVVSVVLLVVDLVIVEEEDDDTVGVVVV